MMQVPAVKGVTVVPLMPQTVDVSELKLIGSPEVTVALTEPVAPP